ncbi:MAG: RNA methyltransferase [Firmicutes bacterium]|nr:RNA methyltransferase [Bacillota bacterium]MDD4694807.1 RNA methyltransferase [Bacillota bacterium]
MLPYSKMIQGLDNRKLRKKEGLFVVEGPKLLEEALLANLSLKVVYIDEEKSDLYQELIKSAREKVAVYEIASKEFVELSDTVTPQGVLAVAKIPEYKLSDLKTAPFFLVLDGIQDPGNLGTIFRTALASGCGGMILLKNTADPFNPKVVRSAMGALFKIPFVLDVTPSKLARFVKETGSLIWAAMLEDAKPYYELVPKPKTGLIIGNEGAGISKEVFELASERVHIPIDGRAESLNAAIAAGILLFYLRNEIS